MFSKVKGLWSVSSGVREGLNGPKDLRTGGAHPWTEEDTKLVVDSFERVLRRLVSGEWDMLGGVVHGDLSVKISLDEKVPRG